MVYSEPTRSLLGADLVPTRRCSGADLEPTWSVSPVFGIRIWTNKNKGFGTFGITKTPWGRPMAPQDPLVDA